MGLDKKINYEKLISIIDDMNEMELAFFYLTAQAIILEREYMYKMNEVLDAECH